MLGIFMSSIYKKKNDSLGHASPTESKEVDLKEKSDLLLRFHWKVSINCEEKKVAISLIENMFKKK